VQKKRKTEEKYSQRIEQIKQMMSFDISLIRSISCEVFTFSLDIHEADGETGRLAIVFSGLHETGPSIGQYPTLGQGETTEITPP